MCKFAPKTVVFPDMLYRCLGLYNELFFLINQLQLKLDTFVRQLKANFGHSKNLKMERLVVGFILQNIFQAVGYEGLHNVGFSPDMSFSKQILNVIANSLKTIGHFKLGNTGESIFDGC